MGDRMRMDRMRQRVMEQNLNADQRHAEPMMLENGRQDQRRVYQNQMDQRQMPQNQMSQRQMSQNQVSQRQMAQSQIDQTRMEQDKMDMVNHRMLNDNRRQTGVNRMMRNNNVIERRQMQSGHMMKREAGPSFSYTVSTGHP